MGLTNMQRGAIFLLCILALSGTCATRAAPETLVPAQRQQLQLMVAAARTNDITGFVTVTRKQSWRCPVIYSAWYQTNRIPADDADALRACGLARDVGRELLVDVDAIAPSITDGTAKNLSNARQLLELAEWVSQSKGYGNFILGSCARDLAVCGLAYCVVDLGWDMEGASNLIARCHLSSDDPAECARVLNTELGAEVFNPTLVGSAAAKAAEMRQTWHSYAQATRAQMPGEAVRRYIEQYELRTNVIAQASGFFHDDSVPNDLTTLSRWDMNGHSALLAGSSSDKLHYLESLFLFRQTIRRFPEVTSQKNHPFSTDQKAAFWEAWVNHPHGNRDGKVGLAAYTAYRQVTEGRFLDPDRERVYLHRLRHPQD